jgi:hypothetical protein
MGLGGVLFKAFFGRTIRDEGVPHRNRYGKGVSPLDYRTLGLAIKVVVNPKVGLARTILLAGRRFDETFLSYCPADEMFATQNR